MASQMFSESWHRVAGSRARLSPGAQVKRHSVRGTVWYVVRDPFSNKFFRMSQPAYFFVGRLRLDRTIEQVWRECLSLFPDEAPGQQEVVRLLAQLTQGNLLISDLPPDSAMLFERNRQQEQKEFRGKLMNFLFLKFPLLDPNKILETLLPYFRYFFSFKGFAVWFFLVAAALKIVAENWSGVKDQSNGIFAPSNLFLFYVCGIGVKLWHELGHGLVCRYFGGEVRTFGVMMLIMTPMPYVDTSSSWHFTNRWQRVFVASAGMIFEFFIAALAVFIWVSTGPGPLHSMAYNIMVLASVTTLLFNINPLMRFDGYYIFSDIVQIPNLAQRSTRQLKYLLEKYVFDCRHAVSPAQDKEEGHWLWVYGIASGIYRVILLFSIFFVLSEHFFGLGIVLAMIMGSVWILVPLWKFCSYLATDPGLEKVRSRAIGITAGVVGGLFLFLALVPFPNRFRAEGIVEAEEFSRMFAETDGSIKRIVSPSGSSVKAGQVLIEMENRELEWQVQAARAQIRETESRLQAVDSEARVTLKPANSEARAAQAMLDNLLKQQRNLMIRAPYDGIYVAPNLQDQVGAWMHRGSQLGEVIDPSSFRFAAVVQQQQAGELFGGRLDSGQVRLRGQSWNAVNVSDIRIIPGKQDTLPSAALGWTSKGEIEVARDDSTGTKTVKPFFLVYARLIPDKNVGFFQRRTGVIRFRSGWDPLLKQWARKLRQIFQEKVQNQ